MNIEYGFTILNVNIPYFVPVLITVFFYFTGQGDYIKITAIGA
jgi:hypothetical protein